MKSPREAVTEAARIIRQNPEDTREADLIIEGALQVIPGLLQSKSTEGKPPGWSSPDEWREMISLVGHYDQLRRTPAVEEVATNRFVE